MVVLAYPIVRTVMHLRMLRYSIRLSLQYHRPIALAFGRGTVAKPSRGFPLQYCLLIALAFKRGAGAKLSKRVPPQHRLLIALAFERGTVAKLSGAFRLSVKRLGRVDSQFIVICVLGTYNSWKQKVKGIPIYERIKF